MHTFPTEADRATPTHEAAGYVVVVAPVMPVERLQPASPRPPKPSSGTTDAMPAHEGPDALVQDWLREPWVQAALAVLPQLSADVNRWRLEPSEEAFASIRTRAIRYMLRMTTRAYPTTLFAAVSTGAIGPAARLDLGGPQSLRRHSSLSLRFLRPLVAATMAQAPVQRALHYVVNPSLAAHPGGWQTVEEQWHGGRPRRTLIFVPRDPLVERILGACATACDFARLVDLAAQAVTDASADEVDTYVRELIESQVLVPTLAVNLTGPEPAQRLIDISAGCHALAEFNETLRRAQAQLAALDAGPVDALASGYRRLANALGDESQGALELPHFHIDLHRAPRDLQFPAPLVPDILEAVEVLRMITPPSPLHRALARFHARLHERHGEQAVNLLAALDEQTGIGFSAAHATAPEADGVMRREARLRELAQRHCPPDGTGIALSAQDVAELAACDPLPLPDLFTVRGNLLASRDDADPAATHRFRLREVTAGVGAFGRFARSDPVLAEHLRDTVRQEASLRPQAILAEFVHLADDARGDHAVRPALRSTDLPYPAGSGLAIDAQIRAADLSVRAQGGRIVLRSRRLGREILPRSYCDHFVDGIEASVHGFIAALCVQDGASALQFSWGVALEAADALPRIRWRDTVLAPASWRIDEETLEAWSVMPLEERWRDVRRVRAQRGIPRWVHVGALPIELALDLENPLCIAVLVDELRYGPSPRLRELAGAPESFCLSSPDGRHAGEFLVPFVRRPRPA